jgi:7-cyano-7-deazaguanine synthase
MRNALFLTIAANFARSINCRDLYTGVCEADNANYPDCRASFISAQEWAIQEALADESFEIHTPLIDTTKAESIRLAKTLPGCMDALAYSHTSYSGEYPPVTQDHSTVLRAQGFLEAGVPDPLIVRAWREGRMLLPTTKNYFDLHSAAGTFL